MAAMEDSVRSALKELCGRWQQQLEADMQQQLQLQIAKCEDLSRLAEHRLLRELRFESKSSESLQKKGQQLQQVPLKALQSEASEASPASPRLGPAWSVSLKVADADGHEIQGAEIADGVDSNDVHHNMVRRSNSYEDAKARGNRMRFHRAEMQRTVSLAEAEYEHCQERIQRLPLSPWFDVFWALVIASNAAYLGIELSAAQQNSLAVHFGYACLFSIELVMRLYAVGFRAYICDEGWAWNWLDLTVVSTSWVDIIMDFLGESAGTTGSSFRVLRLFRVSRLLRIVKTLWIVRFVGALRTLVSSLMDTLKPLFWAMCLLLIIIYIAALLFTDVVLQHLSENPNLAPMKKYFGDLGIPIQTLFRSISGGIDWADAADALTPLGDFWVLLFQFYIATRIQFHEKSAPHLFT